MSLVRTGFSPQKHGFQFANRFEVPFGVSFKLPFGGSVDLREVVYGLCGGMCSASLDFFYLHQDVPPFDLADGIEQRFFIYLWDRQIDSLGPPVLLKLMAWMLMEDGEMGLRIARYEVPKLCRRLEKGDPVVLALIRVRGVSDPTKNHQVLATGYALDTSSRKMTIYLYDPNHPCEEPTLELDLSRPSQGIQIRQSTGEPLRGFFILPYQRRNRVPQVDVGPAAAPEDLRLESDTLGAEIGAPKEPLAFRLAWPVDSRRVNQGFGENPQLYKPFGLPGHEGLDLYAPTNANVYAAADGVVYEADQPDNHPYGLQVRIKHQGGGKTFRTIYGHLANVFVSKGQKVVSGDLIGRADNTGNSFGSHLHLTLKIDGEVTSGYPAGIVDPMPYLEENRPVVAEPGKLTVYTTALLSLQADADLAAAALAILPAGEPMLVLESADIAREKVGREGKWIQVKTAAGLAGFAPAGQLTTEEFTLPPSDLVVYPTDPLNLRSGPATAFNVVAILAETDPLTVLGDGDNARSKLGQQGEWLQVQTASGQTGYAAAWFLHATGQVPPPSDLVVSPTIFLNIRARPNLQANILTVASPGDKLTVLGDAESARARVGQMDKWINVRTPDGFAGYAAAWFLNVQKGFSSPPPVSEPDKLIVFPSADLNIRAQPSINSPRVGGVFTDHPLRVLAADLIQARSQVGVQGQWLHVETEDNQRGWCAAWFLRI